MTSFVDEGVSPSLVRHPSGLGYGAVHPRDRGWPGPSGRSALARGGSRPGDLLVNAVLTIDEAGRIDVEPVP